MYDKEQERPHLEEAGQEIADYIISEKLSAESWREYNYINLHS